MNKLHEAVPVAVGLNAPELHDGLHTLFDPAHPAVVAALADDVLDRALDRTASIPSDFEVSRRATSLNAADITPVQQASSIVTRRLSHNRSKSLGALRRPMDLDAAAPHWIWPIGNDFWRFRHRPEPS